MLPGGTSDVCDTVASVAPPTPQVPHQKLEVQIPFTPNPY